MDERWVVLRICLEDERADLLNLLDDGVVPHRERAAELRDRDVTHALPFHSGTRFGAPAPRELVIEVPVEDLVRAEQILATHYAELEHAAEHASGLEPRTADAAHADRAWVEENRTKPLSTNRRTLLACAVFAAVVYGALAGVSSRRPRHGFLRVHDDLVEFGRASVDGEDGYVVELVHDESHDAVLGVATTGTALLFGRPSQRGVIAIEKPTPAQRAWHEAQTAPPLRLHGHAVYFADLERYAPDLWAQYPEHQRKGGGDTWVLVVDR